MLEHFLDKGTPTLPQTCRRNTNTSHRERDDEYTGTVIQFNARWRLIICKDNIQWIVQKRTSKDLNKGMWLGKSYLTTREAVIAVCSSQGWLEDPARRAVLDALPQYARAYLQK